MERLEIETNRGTSAVIFEVTPGGIVVCNIPLIGTVTLPWRSIHVIHAKLSEIVKMYTENSMDGKSKKRKRI